MQLKQGMDSFQCAYCQSIYLPEKNDDGVRVLDEAVGLACPTCRAQLMQAVLANTRLVYCTACRGMLITMPAFQTLVDEWVPTTDGATVPPAADSNDLRRKIPCPRCHRTMDAHFYAGPGNVILDSCEDCLLIWLDYGELKRIAQARKADEMQ
jgi:Zn-finger nucleic acid-binding protein